MKRLQRAAVLLLAVLPACTEEAEAPRFTNPFDPRNGQGLPVPDAIDVLVGSNFVSLSWSVPSGESVDEFAVFRRRIDTTSPEPERLLARVTSRTYDDAGVRNGRAYAYRIAAGRDHQFGPRSEPVEARPGVFSIVIAGDAPKTGDRNVLVSLNAPGAEGYRLLEDPDSPSVPCRAITPASAWTLTQGDGPKTLYGIFCLPGGSETLPVSDTIVLDTQARIDSVGFDGPDVRPPGDTIHFWLAAGEPGGTAGVDVAGLFTGLQLFDNGPPGDRAAGDGVYERDAVIPAGRTVVAAAVTAQFTDEVGNQVTGFVAPRTLSVRAAPDPVQLVEPADVALPPDAAAVTLRWTRSLASDFSAYQIFRSETAPVDSTDHLLQPAITTSATLQFTDRDVVEGRAYFYRVYVLTSGSQRGSTNTLRVLVPNLRPPAAVVLEEAEAAAEARLWLSWSRSADRDFAAYRVYRSDSPAVTDADSLVQSITDVYRTYWDERDLVENTTYHYRLYVVDTAGFSTPSNEIAAITANAPPEAVQLLPAADIGSTAATLSWERSTARDFGFYRLYRAETPTVTTASTLVHETNDANATSYRDTGLFVSTTYYYRIFVVDEGENPLSTGSNTISFTTSS